MHPYAVSSDIILLEKAPVFPAQLNTAQAVIYRFANK